MGSPRRVPAVLAVLFVVVASRGPAVNRNGATPAWRPLLAGRSPATPAQQQYHDQAGRHPYEAVADDPSPARFERGMRAAARQNTGAERESVRGAGCAFRAPALWLCGPANEL